MISSTSTYNIVIEKCIKQVSSYVPITRVFACKQTK